MSEHNRSKIEQYETKYSLLYRPINPKLPFNSSSIGINEITKKNNMSLITNNIIKNIIIKFRNEKNKKSKEKKKLYRNRSFHDYEEEKKTHFEMLKAMLRKDLHAIHNLIIKDNIKNMKKANKSNLSSDKLYKNNRKDRTLFSFRKDMTSLSFNKKKLLSQTLLNSKSFLINKSTGQLFGHESLSAFEKRRIDKRKKYELKIKNAHSMSCQGGKFLANKLNNLFIKKFNQDTNFCLLNVKSEKLGVISLFGIFDGNGPNGKAVSTFIKEYIINYFLIGEDMRVTIKRDNFYSIMYNSFSNAQNHIIKNNSIDLEYSGATGCVVLYPKNNTNKIYCANLGRNKCKLYTMFGSIRLSYELYPSRASESYRISLLRKKREKNKLISTNENNNENDGDTEEQNQNNINIMNSKINESVKNFISEKERENYLKEFFDLDISRCVGNLFAEELGIIPGPEVVECDIRINKGKFIVMGTNSLWKYLDDDEIGTIVNKYFGIGDSIGACKELEETAKERWKSNTGGCDDISVAVIFLDLKNLDIPK